MSWSQFNAFSSLESDGFLCRFFLRFRCVLVMRWISCFMHVTPFSCHVDDMLTVGNHGCTAQVGQGMYANNMTCIFVLLSSNVSSEGSVCVKLPMFEQPCRPMPICHTELGE